ncbi:hypothetical protein ACLKA7_005655 [Drosophila subpalustris]
MMISNDNMHSKIKYLQAQDDELKAIIDILAEKDTHNNYFMKSDLLHKLVDDDELIVVPLALQREIIKQAHEKGHFSVKKTKDMIVDTKRRTPKRLSEPKKWSDKEVGEILNYMQVHRNIEKPTAQVYYKKLLEQTKIEATWNLVRYKDRLAKSKFV